MYTSRSEVEAYQDCPRYRFNQYHLLDKGVVPVAKSIPLVTGGAVHRGVEHLLNRVRIGETADVEMAVQIAKDQYATDCEIAGFSGKGVQTDRQMAYTFGEQKALVEGLIRAWALVELPNIIGRYKVVAVEREVEPLEIALGVMFMARVDAEFREIGSGDYFNYSLKTMKSWNERSENSYKSDLQGVTEIWAVEEDAKRFDRVIDKLTNGCDELIKSGQFPLRSLHDIALYLTKRKMGKKVSGVRFCILIKGERKKPDYYGNDPDALYVTYNPLIRGYKKVTPTEILYAWSWFVPKPENKSGKGTIGQGWVPFNVWESDISIKEWIEALNGGLIQPECGNPVRQQVVAPVEYFRDEEEIETAIREIRAQEKTIAEAIKALEGNYCIPSTFLPYNTQPEQVEQLVLDACFPHIRKHCEFHFGGPCEYKDLCWKPEVRNDPLGSGLYQIRESHHSSER